MISSPNEEPLPDAHTADTASGPEAPLGDILKMSLSASLLTTSENRNVGQYPQNEDDGRLEAVRTSELFIENTLDELREQREQLLRERSLISETLDNLESPAVDNGNSDYCSDQTNHTSYWTVTYEINKTLARFMTPYFRDLNDTHPKFNEETEMQQRNDHILPTRHSSARGWSRSELDKLNEMVALTERARIINGINARHQRLGLDIQETTQELDKIRDLPLDTFIPPLEKSDQIAWLDISMLIKDRTADDCELAWRNRGHPSINESDWTEAEEKKLIELAAKHQLRNWETIAVELATNRTPFACFEHFQSKLNSQMKLSGRLTDEEKDLIDRLVSSLRVGNYIPWHQIHLFLESRSLAQIKEYYHKKTLPSRGRRFSPLEDEIIYVANLLFPGDWTTIAKFLRGRDGKQVRERFVLRLENAHRQIGAEWTPEEDRLLVAEAEREAFSWVKVAKHFPHRSYKQISTRYRRLQDLDLIEAVKGRDLTESEAAKMNSKPRKQAYTWARSEIYVKRLRTKFKGYSKSRLEEYLAEAQKKISDDAHVDTKHDDGSKAKKRTRKTTRTPSPRKKTSQKLSQISSKSQLVDIFAESAYLPRKSRRAQRTQMDQTTIDISSNSLLHTAILSPGTGTAVADPHDSDPPIVRSQLYSLVDHHLKSHVSCSSSSELSILPPSETSMRAFQLLRRQLNTSTTCGAAATNTTPLEECDLNDSSEFHTLTRALRSTLLWPAIMSPQEESVTTAAVRPPTLHWAPLDVNTQKTRSLSWLMRDPLNRTRLVDMRRRCGELLKSHIEAQGALTQPVASTFPSSETEQYNTDDQSSNSNGLISELSQGTPLKRSRTRPSRYGT